MTYFLQRFMSEYVRVHYKKIQSGDEDRQKKVKTWKTFMQKLKKQVKLFMVSCVQIASKMCSHYKVTSHSNKTTLVHKSLFVCLFVCLYVCMLVFLRLYCSLDGCRALKGTVSVSMRLL